MGSASRTVKWVAPLLIAPSQEAAASSFFCFSGPKKTRLASSFQIVFFRSGSHELFTRTRLLARAENPFF